MIVAAATVAPLSGALAQDFFGSLFGRFGQSPQYRSAAPAYAPDDRYHSGERQSRASYAGGSGTYCVRLCDGRYFPIPKVGAQVSSAKVCSAMCPRAATKVFSGGDPTRSVAADGTRYENLDNALVYRDKIVPDCSCTGNGPGGLARIDIESDPTLRSGDIVATAAGLQAFNGSSTLPHKTADFSPIESSSKVSAGLREILAGIRINNTVHYNGPVQSLTGGSASGVASVDTTIAIEGNEVRRPRRQQVRVMINPQQQSQPQPQPQRGWGNSWGGRSWGSWGGGW